MTRQRQQTTDHSTSNQVTQHIQTLRFESVAAYQQWCVKHGFSRKLQKSQAQRRRERQARAVTMPESQVRSDTATRLPHRQLIAAIFSGAIVAEQVTEPHHRDLCDAVRQLKDALTPSEWQAAFAAFQQLYTTCQSRRAKFLPDPRGPATRNSDYTEALAAIAVFHQRWLRPLSDWRFRTHNVRRQFDSLVTHLFAAFPVPRFFYSVWTQRLTIDALSEQEAFIYVGKGHNLRQATLPIPYTKRMAHHFLQAPDHLSYQQALRWGQVKGLGGDAALARAVTQTFLVNNFNNHTFWQSVITWFIRHPRFERDQFAIVADYLNHVRFGFGNVIRAQPDMLGRHREIVESAEQPHLSMKGRTPDSLRKAVNRWHRQLYQMRDKNHLSWRHAQIPEFDWQVGDKSPVRWTIHQLLNSRELIVEGREMQHCVASYRHECMRGKTSIWSLQRTERSRTQRVLTLEVCLAKRVIVQARGLANRAATPAEQNILRRWAQIAGVKLT